MSNCTADIFYQQETVKKKIMIVGGGGREAAFAQNLAQDSALYALISHDNPTIIRCVQASGGAYAVGNPSDADAVLQFARQHRVDYAFVSADDPLANGVVDALCAGGVTAVGGSRDATRIEWDKVYSIGIMQDTCPEFTPFHVVVEAPEQVADALAQFRARGAEVVVKPQGLTGGKGVKVMPIHLPDYDAAAAYAHELLAGRAGEQVLLVEKLHGLEFTIMGITDGENLVMAPATYDYPYRLEGDEGPGTGGMGCFTAATPALPFMRQRDWDDCRTILQRVIDRLRANCLREGGLAFNGVLNGGFFLTPDGIRFMEFNGRFGDPEALNTIPLLATPLSEMIADMAHGTLSSERVKFHAKASVVKYLVAKEYPDASPAALDFQVDEEAIAAAGLTTTYASCVAVEGAGSDTYRTLKKSRVLALTALSDSISEGSEAINAAIDAHIRGDLHYRRDIGAAEEIARLTRARPAE